MAASSDKSKKNHPTLADIARLAGCSVGTVSGILNRKGSHAPAMVARVMEAVRATGFVPRKKSSLEMGPTGSQFALFFPEDDAPGTARATFLGISMTRGAEEILAGARHHLLTAESRSDGSVPALINKGQADGVILRGANYPRAFLESLRGIPCVWAFGVHTPPLDMDLVSVDNVRLGVLAADRFAESGVGQVIIMNRLNEDNLEILIRVLSCEHALRQRGISVSRLALESSTIEPPVNMFSGKRHTGLFIPGHDTDVLKVCGFLHAQGLMEKTEFLGTVADHKRVLASYPDTRLIRIDPEAVGRAAANQLLWRLENLHAPPQTVLVRAIG